MVGQIKDSSSHGLLRKLFFAVLTAIIGTIATYAFNQYFISPTDVTGTWYVEEVYEKSDMTKYRGMKLKYIVVLSQDVMHLSGSGEKIWEFVDGKEKEYVGSQRTRLDVSGTISCPLLSEDKVNIQYVQHGARRESSTSHVLTLLDDVTMNGEFQSTVANSSGRVSWKRNW